MSEYREKKRSSSHHSSSHSSKKSSSHSSKKRHRSRSPEEDEWIEKAPSLPSTSSTFTTRTAPPVDTIGTFTVGDTTKGLSSLSSANMTDGYGEGEEGSSTYGGRGGGQFGKVDDDLFSSMGIERKRAEPKAKIDPTVCLFIFLFIYSFLFFLFYSS